MTDPTLYTMHKYENKSNAAVIYLASGLISLQAHLKTFHIYMYIYLFPVCVCCCCFSPSVCYMYMTEYYEKRKVMVLKEAFQIPQTAAIILPVLSRFSHVLRGEIKEKHAIL